MELFKSFLGLVATDSTMESCIRSYNALNDVGVAQHQKEIEELIISNQDFTNDEILYKTREVLLNYSKDTMYKFSITPSEEAELNTLTTIINALLTLPEYGDIDSIQYILQKEQVCVDTLCDLVELIEDITWENVALAIDAVDDSLIAKINQVVNEVDVIERPKNIDSIITRVKKYLESETVFVYNKALRSGVVLGSDIVTIMEVCEAELSNLLTSPDQFIKELIGVLLISDIDNAKLLGISKCYLEEFVDNVDQISKLTTKLETGIGYAI